MCGNVTIENRVFNLLLDSQDKYGKASTDSIILLLYYKRKLNDNNYVHAPNESVAIDLGWTNKRVGNSRNVLIDFNLIRIKRDANNGVFKKSLVEVLV